MTTYAETYIRMAGVEPSLIDEMRQRWRDGERSVSIIRVLRQRGLGSGQLLYCFIAAFGLGMGEAQNAALWNEDWPSEAVDGFDAVITDNEQEGKFTFYEQFNEKEVEKKQ